jgi:APA family basic amino acid/polyamine antiporter
MKLGDGTIIEGGLINLPAIFIVCVLSLVLIRGTQESATMNNVLVILKVAVVLMFITLGWSHINPENYVPYIPENTGKWENFGWTGISTGAAVVFFAFIGFDAVSTAAQEAKNPQKGMPIGILGSLIVCTILYVLFAHVMTGLVNFKDFAGDAKPAATAFAMTGYTFLQDALIIAILAGYTSVILVMLMGQSRIFYTMSNDGLIPKVFGELHPKYKTPYKANWILFIFVGLFAAFVPGHVAGDLTSFGTLFAFVLVSLGVWILRIKSPNIERPFRTPLAPVVSILGAAICLAMIIGLDGQTLKVAFGWMALGLIVYFGYSRKHSKIHGPVDFLPKASDFESK